MTTTISLRPGDVIVEPDILPEVQTNNPTHIFRFSPPKTKDEFVQAEITDTIIPTIDRVP